MKVDSIYTSCGDFIIGYTKLKRGFYIESYPEIIKAKSGMIVRSGRDSYFSSINEIEAYVKEVVNNFKENYLFVRKVICYQMSISDYSFCFNYMVCNENEKIHMKNKARIEMHEYYVLETNLMRLFNRRDTMGQLVGGDNYIIIDYDEAVHKFIVDFVNNFEGLKSKLKAFFEKDNIHKNIMQSLESKQKLIG